MSWVWLFFFITFLLLAYYLMDQLDKEDERRRHPQERMVGKK